MPRPIRTVLVALIVALPAVAQQAKPQRTPNPVLVESFKDVTGTWTCLGTATNPAAPGTPVKTKGVMKVAREVDGFAYSGDFREKDPATGALMMQGRILWAWDTGKKKLVEFGAGTDGMSSVGTSDGFKDGTIVWLYEGVGETPKGRRTLAWKQRPGQLTQTYEIETPSGWQKVFDGLCTKS